jgi:hypothetical protein
MSPRRPSSKKWTAFPKEFSDNVHAVFKDSFGAKIGDATLILDGRIYPEELALRVGIREKGRLKQANFETSVDYEADKPETLDRIHDLVDVCASMMMEYLETDGEVEFPFAWKEYPFKGKSIYLQYNGENSELEEQANALLGISGEALLHEEPASQDALDRAEKGQLH